MISFFIAALAVYVVARIVTAAAPQRELRCDEKGKPHQWVVMEQPWDIPEETPPTYLQCKACGCIYGSY